MKPRVGISACLLGHEVRWDGGHKRDVSLVRALGRQFEWVPVCPEVELGLGVPREPIRLVGRVGAPRLVAESGRDLTAGMRRFARARAADLARRGLSGFVFKARSPSCGLDGVLVHRVGRPPVRSGRGMFSRVIAERMPLVPVEEEGRLRERALRESFVARVFACRRWQLFVAERPTRADLVAFHAAHEAEIAAHDPRASARLRRLANGGARRPLRAVLEAYGAQFVRAFR